MQGPFQRVLPEKSLDGATLQTTGCARRMSADALFLYTECLGVIWAIDSRRRASMACGDDSDSGYSRIVQVAKGSNNSESDSGQCGDIDRLANLRTNRHATSRHRRRSDMADSGYKPAQSNGTNTDFRATVRASSDTARQS